MTNASECHRDAVFVCGGDRFVVLDRSAETGDSCQACARLLSLWERLGEGAKLESQDRKPDPGYRLREKSQHVSRSPMMPARRSLA